MPIEPRITVAIPTCNGERHLRQTLISILEQNAEFDLLVCDDRSEDDGLVVVRETAGDRARAIVNSERLGLAKNWNQCVTLCHTRLITIFHQDDMMLKRHLATHLAQFHRDPNQTVGMVASAARVIDEAGEAVPERIAARASISPIDCIFPPAELRSALIASNPIRCSGVSLRVTAHADLGGFNPAYQYIVDWDFWRRLAERWSVAWLAKPTVAVRQHPGSETERFKTGSADLDEIEAYLVQIDKHSSPADQSAIAQAKQTLARAYLNRAHIAIRHGDRALARACWRSARRIWPGILGIVARDPRLAFALTALKFAPWMFRS